MVHLAELSVRATVWFKIIGIYAQSMSRVHRQKHLDDDATGWRAASTIDWYRQTALAHRSDVFCVYRRQLFWSGKLSPAEQSRCCLLIKSLESLLQLVEI